MGSSGNGLQALLQLHLATDASAAYNLPTVLTLLSSEDLESSPHVTKWTTRINALIHSKDTGARWAGIVLALESSKLSRTVLLNSSQGWITTILPMLSRNEYTIIWKAIIRLLAFIFLSTTNLSEFQRTVGTPNVTKFSTALISLIEKNVEDELKALCSNTLASLVPLYPNLHRSLASKLFSVSLNMLNGTPLGTPAIIVSSASKLHACLHTTGGKVGSAALWRKDVGDTVSFCLAAIAALRSTSTAEGKAYSPLADPIVDVALNVDKLQCGVTLLSYLLHSTVPRPVPVPVHSIVRLCIKLTKVTEKNDAGSEVDPHRRNMENSVIPRILEIGCTLLECTAKCVKNRISPYMTTLLNIASYQLEQSTPLIYRLPFIKLLPPLLSSTLPPSDPLLAGRLIKAILPCLTSILSEKKPADDQNRANSSSKKGKKRVQGYEGDEIFKAGRDVLCGSNVEAEVILAALDALQCLLRVPNIPVYLRSLSTRLLISILLALQNLPATSVSRDLALKDKILIRARDCCIEVIGVSSSVLCTSLPLVVQTMLRDESTSVDISRTKDTRLLDLMIHPRLPPLVRSLPSLDSITLCKNNESKDEKETREKLGLDSNADDVISHENKRNEVQANDTSTTQGIQQNVPTYAPQIATGVVPVVTSFNSFNSRPSSTVQMDVHMEVETTQTFSSQANNTVIPRVKDNEVNVTTTNSSTQQTIVVPRANIIPRSVAESIQAPKVTPEVRPTVPQNQQPPVQSGLYTVASDDEEDIEMPELNLESDTDPEE